MMNSQTIEKKNKLVERISENLNYLRYIVTMLANISESNTVAALHNLDDTMDKTMEWAVAIEEIYKGG